MLTLHRLPPFLRVLYVAISVFWVLALASHWLRLSLRHGVRPQQVREWYLGNEQDEDADVMLFERSWREVFEDSWGNLFHHTLALMVMAGLMVRTEISRRTKGWLSTALLVGLPLSAAGPILIRGAVPGAAAAYLGALAVLQLCAVAICALVLRDAVIRRGAGSRGKLGGSVAGILFLLLAAGAVTVEAQTDERRLMTVDDARAEAFPSAAVFEKDTVRVSAELRSALEAELGRPIFENFFIIDRALDENGGLLGYALVTDERGKYRPITMMVSVNPGGEVVRVAILIYRESRGGEVARNRFLRQYRGRTYGDPIRINRDIVNVSGATISVVSVNHGVRKTLALLRQVYP